ncbi:MAG: glycoside hydrolase family 3 C-terminal domain-containing protein, partial [Saccharofermentans sp.]|nr:glycoside hydrolase family 3 C-terminal domain-containing protein [Saccharofermentans sp.]
KPTVTCIVAGRHVIIDESDYKNWDSVVMCYLPGSEGKGISDVLCGCVGFSGKLPSPWYGSLDQIGTDNCFLKKGYGLTYGDGFTARTEPETVLDAPAKAAANPADGTNYKKGLFKDGVYVNDCTGLKAKIVGDLKQLDENELRESMAHTRSKCTTAKDKARENATFYDASFGSEVLGIDLKFVNIKLASPDDPGYDENKYLDDYGKFFKEMLKDYPITIEYKGRTKATLSGKEYVRDTFTLSGNEGVQTVCIYARKLDDNLMSTVEIYWFGNHTAEEYEKMFS